MSHEIERKFLVAPDWQPPGDGVAYRQGYLSTDPDRTVRVRLEGDAGTLTIKGRTVGITRVEVEYPIPQADAESLLQLCLPPLIDKHRHTFEYAGKTWEVDVFHGANDGLVVAELELDSEAEAFERPPWLGPEVSDDPRYYNANLVTNPYSSWARNDRTGGTIK